MKICNDCGHTGPVEEFYKNATTGYYSNRCLCCHKVINRERAKARSAKQRQKERAVRQAKAGKQYRTAERVSAERFNMDQRKLAVRNAKQAFDWWLMNRAPIEVKAKYGKCYFQSEAEYYRVRYKYDPEFNAKERMRRQLNKQARRDGIADVIRSAITRGGRSNAVESALGYTISDLVAHLESLFTEGMSWDAFNSGEIHIDHIKPKAAFDLGDSEQWVKCWALDNLQPLWAADNLRKSSYYKGKLHHGSLL